MVCARVDLHVSGFGHMALHATIAAAAFRVETMFRWLDDRRIVCAAFMAAHAQHVVFDREDCFEGMWIVAIHASDACVGHAAHLKRAIDKVFVEYLAIVMVQVGLVGQG